MKKRFSDQQLISILREAKVVVTRTRLELAQHFPTREAVYATAVPAWFNLAIDLALNTGQRREDLTRMRFDHVVDGHLQVKQGKTDDLISPPST